MSNLTNYINWLKRKGFANKTIITYLEGIRHYGLNSLTTKNLISFFQQQVNKLEVNTILTRRSALKSYAKFHKLQPDWERIAKVIPKVQFKFFSTINHEELKQLKQAKTENQTKLHQRNNLMLDFLFYTGLRVSELANLKHSDYQNQLVRIHGKGNKVRYVFLPPFLASYFQPASQTYLFTTNQGKPLTKDLIGIIIRKRVKKAGLLKRITPHSFRRSFATNLNNKGAKLTTIQKLLGHSQITTTANYIHNNYDTLFQDYSKLWKNTPTITNYHEPF